jgi:cytochrome c oxidase subunit 1
MFVAGTSLYSALVFSILSYVVAVPSAIKVFNWLGTMHKGFIRFDAPMLYAIGFIGLFTTGGLTGLFVAALAADVHLTHTYFVVAHFHYVMVGGMVSAYFAGLHFLVAENHRTNVSGDVGPSGRGNHLHWLQHYLLPAVHSGLSRHAPSLSLLSAGIRGIERALVRRRDDTGHGLLLPLGYLTWSLFYGERASANPWNATGLEGQTSSPPFTENFDSTPTVTEPPYNCPPPEVVRRHV